CSPSLAGLAPSASKPLAGRSCANARSGEVPADGVVVREGERAVSGAGRERRAKGGEGPWRVFLPGQGGEGGLDQRQDRAVVGLGGRGQRLVTAGQFPLEQLQPGGERLVPQHGRETVHAGEHPPGQVGAGTWLVHFAHFSTLSPSSARTPTGT